MTTTTVETTAQEALVAIINEVRVTAKQEETREAAVDAAITGTVLAIEAAAQGDNLDSVIGLNEALGKNWAAEVNS